MTFKCPICFTDYPDEEKKYPLDDSAFYHIKICGKCYGFLDVYQDYGKRTYTIPELSVRIKEWRSNIDSNRYNAGIKTILEQRIKAYNAKYKELSEEQQKLDQNQYQKILQTQKELAEKQLEMIAKVAKAGIQVTTMDLNEPYSIISPIIFNTTNRGIFKSAYTDLVNRYQQPGYKDLLLTADRSHTRSSAGLTMLSLFDSSFSFEGNVGHEQFDMAFYIALAEMKIRAYKLGGDAIIGLKMDFDLDTTNYGAFYLNVFGTVVKTQRLQDLESDAPLMTF